MTKLIGITQREEDVVDYKERRDSLDQSWTLFLNAIGYNLVPIPNQLINMHAYLEGIDFDGFILTGGNDTNLNVANMKLMSARDKTERALLEYAEVNCMPVVGVCRGLQVMNIYFGGRIEAVKNHVAVDHSINWACDILHLDQLKLVNSYHNFGIRNSGVSEALLPLAFDDNGYVEAVKHRQLPWYGMMWHPERELEFSVHHLNFFKHAFTDKI